MFVRLSVVASLCFIVVCSHALPTNHSITFKSGDNLFGTVDVKEKLAKLGMLSDFSYSDESVETTWNDMYVAGLTVKVIQNGYQKEFGVRPDNQHINDDFAHKWGWYSFNNLGKISVLNVKVQPKSSVTNERYLTNDGDNAITHSITLSSTVSNSATTTVTSTSQISTSASITIGAEDLGISATFSESFTFSNTVS